MRWLPLLCLCACTDVGGYRGEWRGTPEASSLTLVGMAPDHALTLQLATVTRDFVSGSVDGDELRPMAQAAADQLGQASLPDSLRNYWNAVTLPDGDALALVSLYQGDRVDLRLIRSDTLFVVAHLKRWNGN